MPYQTAQKATDEYGDPMDLFGATRPLSQPGATTTIPGMGSNPYQSQRTGSGMLTGGDAVNGNGITAGQAQQTAQQLVNRGGPGSSYQVGPQGEVVTNVKGPDPFASRLSQLSQMGLMSGGQSAAPAAPAPVSGADGAAGARAAAFARAKDQAALIAQKGLEGVQNIMAARGLQGSTIEQGGVNDVFAGATNSLGNVSRDMAIQDAQRAAEVDDRNYSGGITMRGQDIGAHNADRASLIALINAAGAY